MGDKDCHAGDLVDHKYSRLTNLPDLKCPRSPAYAETVEISTTEDFAVQETIKCQIKVEAGVISSDSSALHNYLHSSEMMTSIPLSQSKVDYHLPEDQSNSAKVAPSVEDVTLLKRQGISSAAVSEAVRVVVKSELNEVDSNDVPDFVESIDVESKEDSVISGVSNHQINYRNIEEYVIGEPIMLYHYGTITLKCTKVNKRVFSKSFPCSTLGLCDKEAIGNIQNYINSKECIRRLAVVEKLDSSNISEYISEDVKLTRLSNEHVRLVCTYHDGRTITKVFPGSELGIKDPVTRRTVQEFINSEQGRNWVIKGAKGQRGKWVKVGEVPAGMDTKKFISNNVKFDVNQKFIYEKKLLDIVRGEDVLAASVSSHANWGSAHRADDCFVLKVPIESVANTVVARFHLECASLTNVCKTKCGAPISDVTIINGKFSCCGMTKDVQICSNCLIDNTPQWYKIEGDNVICNSCYKYFQRRGVHRAYCRKNNRKERIHESHTKCNWKMKLELRGDDVDRWIIYEHSDNAKDHNIKMPCHTRPTLMVRDKWDKLRSLAKLTPKQILTSESHLRNKMPEIQGKVDFSTFKSIRTRAKVIDSRKKCSLITVEDGIPVSSVKKSSRITVERNFERIVFMQREKKEGNREYHLVICPADSIENLSELEIPVEGYSEQAKFKNGIIVVYYDPFEGVAAAFLISCMEGGLGLAISHELTFRVLDKDSQWSSILQQEKHIEYKYDFKPISLESDVQAPLRINKKCQENPTSVFNFTNITDLVAEKPRVVRISDVRVRLQCVLPGGRFLTKVFPTSNRGIQDPETHRTIQEFLDSKDCRLWIERKQSDTWIRLGEVATGIDTEQYLCHTINFEVMQRFFYRKKFLEITQDGGTMLSALNKPEGLKVKARSRPGIHKVGNKFSLKVPPEEVPNKVVATMYIDCASMSEHCKTKCGHLANEVSVVDGLFSCCGLPKEQVQICCNCYTDNSDRWSKIAEDSFLCHTCHNYYKKKNRHRQSCMTKTKRKKIHENHVKCEWKMKLELRASDITRWQVFKYHLNREAHESKPFLPPDKRKLDSSKEEKNAKKMKLINDRGFHFSTEECTRIIKAFPRYSTNSAPSRQFENSERPDENGFLMYPEIKEYITGLVLRDIICPKEIRLYITQYACENFLVSECHDNKYYHNTVNELRTLVKGFIYYVQSDIHACSKGHESKKLMICLGNGYPTLYFVQDHQNQRENVEQKQQVPPPVVKLLKVNDEGGAQNRDCIENGKNQLVKRPDRGFIVRVVGQNEEEISSKTKTSGTPETPLKIFVTTGIK